MSNEWDEPDEEEEEIGPDDPDYDLSEARGYGWEPPQRPWWRLPPWLIVTVSLVLVLALLLPALVIIALR
ncbi:MAG: hypothetical protein M3P30_15770 [Chloroflexota bacterium]|nr:hypothetical protein [Chloroflexota bacterium]